MDVYEEVITQKHYLDIVYYGAVGFTIYQDSFLIRSAGRDHAYANSSLTQL